ncbi:class I adenylate-forming enzyme family protein [Alkalihalobacterium alkalinitrilicum]|uniref:class I adenylate-forming enzyme family protein n=1 Tax=Alkalihalobacterium alkalinitrilicum TaxID=427920 RepID=UPI000994BBC4|nr:class I adenylate-forming enzyme family protein [Alkalihalobacterium alkalinitrilicum]
MEAIIHMGQIVDKHALRQPNQGVYYDNGREVTYKEYVKEVNRMINAFKMIGLQKGDRIATILPQSKAFITVFTAAAKLGITIVPLDTRLQLPRIQHICERTQPKMLIAQAHPEKLKDKIETILSNIHFEHFYYYLSEVKSEGALPYERLIDKELSDVYIDDLTERSSDDPLLIIFTSGTTGTPKGALITNGNIVAMAEKTAKAWDITNMDRYLLQLPTSHVGGITNLIASMLYAGAKGVFMPDYDPKLMLQCIDNYKLTFVGGVPTMFRIMFRDCDVSHYQLHSIRLIWLGGESSSPHLINKIKSLFKESSVAASFGMTETAGCFTYTDPEDGIEIVANTEGKPGEGSYIKIVKEDGSEAESNEIGEIYVKGSSVISSYLDEEHNMNTFEAGWLKTGDLGSLDEKNYLKYVGRNKEMYISGGYNVYPLEVENYINKFPGVSTSCVVEKDDEIWGQVGIAFIVPEAHSGFDLEALTFYVKNGLSDYQQPKHYIVQKSIPMTPLGKVDKQVLRKEITTYIANPSI